MRFLPMPPNNALSTYHQSGDKSRLETTDPSPISDVFFFMKRMIYTKVINFISQSITPHNLSLLTINHIISLQIGERSESSGKTENHITVHARMWYISSVGL